MVYRDAYRLDPPPPYGGCLAPIAPGLFISTTALYTMYAVSDLCSINETDGRWGGRDPAPDQHTESTQ